jgi:hypothetical protein
MNHVKEHHALNRAEYFCKRFQGPDAPRPRANDAMEAERLVQELAEALILKARPELSPEQAVTKVLGTSVGQLLYQVAAAGRGA